MDAWLAVDIMFCRQFSSIYFEAWYVMYPGEVQ